MHPVISFIIRGRQFNLGYTDFQEIKIIIWTLLLIKKILSLPVIRNYRQIALSFCLQLKTRSIIIFWYMTGKYSQNLIYYFRFSISILKRMGFIHWPRMNMNDCSDRKGKPLILFLPFTPLLMHSGFSVCNKHPLSRQD